MFATPAKRKRLLQTLPTTPALSLACGDEEDDAIPATPSKKPSATHMSTYSAQVAARRALLLSTPKAKPLSTDGTLPTPAAETGQSVPVTPKTPTIATSTTAATPVSAVRLRTPLSSRSTRDGDAAGGRHGTPAPSALSKVLAKHSAVLKPYYEASKAAVIQANARRDFVRNAALLRTYHENNEVDMVEKSIRRWRRVCHTAIERLVEISRSNDTLFYMREAVMRELAAKASERGSGSVDEQDEADDDHDEPGDIFVVCRSMGLDMEHLRYNREDDCFVDDTDEETSELSRVPVPSPVLFLSMDQQQQQQQQKEQYDYFQRHEIHPVLRAICAGLAFHRPESPLLYIKDCVETMRQERVNGDAASSSDAATKSNATHGRTKTHPAGPHTKWDSFITHPLPQKTHRIEPLPQTVRHAAAQHLYQTPSAVHKAEEGRLRQLNSLSVVGRGNSAVVPANVSVSSKHFDRLPGIGASGSSQSKPQSPSFANDAAAGVAAIPDAAKTQEILRGRRVIFVLGGPGTGKGTQCMRLAKEFSLAHLSCGDLLRDEAAKGTAEGAAIARMMQEGSIVPMEITLRLLRAAMAAQTSAKGFLIDGFPRQLDQAAAYEALMGAPDVVLQFDCSFAVLEQRLLKRGETSGRVDDNLESIKKRLVTFTTLSMPVIDHYRQQGKLVSVSSESGVDEVYAVARAKVLDVLTEFRPLPQFNLDGRALIFVLGGPGSGKGTQCARLKEQYNLTHLSAGDLLRAEVATGSELGKQINALIADGKIVPLDVTMTLLHNAMSAADQSNGFLVDGFPREMSQCVEFERRMCTPNAVLFFDCPLTLLEQRLLKRGETSGRSDDNLESIKKRFRTFEETSMPVVRYYEAIGKVVRVSSEPPVDEVFAAACQGVERYMPSVAAKAEPKLAQPPRTAATATAQDVPITLLPNVSRNIVLVLGGPGSGKGTQCDRIVESLGYVHLSTGDLLREECAQGSALGRTIEQIMKEGSMVSMDITRKLLISAMNRHPQAKGFLLDGYPRTVEQADDVVQQFGRPVKVIYYECPQDVLVERLLERGKTSGRADDNLESIKKRITTFLDTTMPVVQYFERLGLVSVVPSNLEVAEVTRQTLALFHAPSFRNVVLVLGGPGSGKGTQCANIVSKLGFVHLSCGDLLRAEVAQGTPLGVQIANIMKEGQMVSMDITRRLLLNAMSANTRAKGFLIDGYPRTVVQAQDFLATICKPAAVLYYEAPEEVLVERLLERGKTSGRADDNLESIQKRIKTFLESSLPVVEFFETHEQAVSRIPAVAAVEEITALTMSVLEPLVFHNVVLVLGGPGSGKGTQCANLVQNLQYVHLSTGDLLRAEVASGSPLGSTVAGVMKEGGMVPMEIIRQVLLQAMDQKRATASGFLIDGYPRTVEQAVDFEETIVKPTSVLYYECPEDVLVQRLLERGKTSGRADDNLESIKTRIATFLTTTMPVIEHYEQQGVVHKIPGTLTVDEITAATMAALAEVQ
ncbi:hypothetical protein RI367_007066 [Sorochytrium milnesiophthora]